MKCRPACLFLVVALFPACAVQQRVRVPVLHPAVVDLGRHSLLGMDKFGGEGDVLIQELTAALRKAKNPQTGTIEFEIVERRNAPKGDWKKARVLLKGDVLAHGVREEIEEQPGALNRQKQVRLRRAIANVSVTILMHDTRRNKTFDRVHLEEVVAATTKAVGEEPAPIDHAALLATARRKVVARYMNRILPRQEWVEVALYKDEKLPELDAGNGYAKTGEWDRALRAYHDAAERARGDLSELRYKALYNIGVALLYTHEFAAARDSLKQAYDLEKDKQILQQIKTVAGREQDFQRLRGSVAQPPR